MTRSLATVAIAGGLLAGLTACEAGPALPPRATVASCRPLVDGAPVATLGETGCFTDVEALEPAPDLVPYGVRSPLWTDGAGKSRWVVVPPGERLRVDGDALDIPDGTILVKLFEMRGVDGALRDPMRLEVRFLVLDAFAWRPFTYRFDEDGREARLLTAGEDVELTVDEQPIAYHFPDELTCEACHYSGRPVLGFSLEQLNFRYDYGVARENQLAALRDADLLEDGPVAATRPPLVSPGDPEEPDLEARARSWLHANCAHCHRPGGWASSIGMDLRYEVPTDETATCGERTRYYGLFGPDRIVPGDPDGSGIVMRMREEGLSRMPPIGVSVIDPTGEAIVTRWIASLRRCP